MMNSSTAQRALTIILSISLSLTYQHCKAQAQPNLVDNVNPFIGVLDEASYCTIGPQLPFGSVNPGPQTPEGGNDGYTHNQPIRGFGQLHVSGTGWGKYGQFLVSPQIGLNVDETGHDSPKSNETAKAYYYAVTLNRYKIKTELAPTLHAVMYRFTFPQSNDAHIAIDVTHSLTRDIATHIGGNVSAGDVMVDSITKDKITGYGRYSGGFGDGRYNVYFCARISKPSTRFGTWKDKNIGSSGHTSITRDNERIGAFFNLQTTENEPVYLKIAVSLKSVQQAETWLTREIPDWNFEAVQENAKAAWNRELGKIIVESDSKYDKMLFYSALYRSMMMPRDRTNDIEGWPDQAPLWDDHYAVWDTWRTVFPLMTIINPAMVRDNVNAFIERYKKNHVVKDAFVAGIDMFKEQGGNNIDNVIAEAYVKGIQGIDWNKAYAVLKFDADSQRLGLQNPHQPLDKNMAAYKTKGWIPGGIMSCSISLEYSYNDFCTAEVAKGLGKDADYQKYFNRSQKWSELWNPNLESKGYKGFIGPKKLDNTWIDIDPTFYWGSWNNYFYESSSWTYSLFVPHALPKLVELCGGPQKFADRLNFGFTNNLIDYWNEPAFLAAQAFHYANRPDLASYWTKKMMTEKYSEKGYPGNEDSGAMGSWYVFAALGIFPNAGQPIYYINGPSFKNISIWLGNEKKLTIEAHNLSKDNIYVQSCTLNGKKLNSTIITHSQLMEGGLLEFNMGPKPTFSSK
jgi:predicted alpha-1,2-mannosidase